MYENVVRTVQTLTKASRIYTGGLCEVLFTPIENVLTWPAINPETGGVDDEIELKPNTVLYSAELNPHTKIFDEETQESLAGTHHKMEINATMPGNVAENMLTLGTMLHHRFLVFFKERDGSYRFLGNQDSGARLSYKYTSGDRDKSRGRSIKFIWAHPNPAPVYLGALSTIPINIASGGTLMFLERFKVKAGQPMEPGDYTYSHASLANKKIFMLINREKVPEHVNDMEGEQYIDKAIDSVTATIKIEIAGLPSNAPVNENDIIEVYAHD